LQLQWASGNIQDTRYEEAKGIHCNAQMTSRQLRKICRLDETGMALLKNAMEKLNLSARAYDRILKVEPGFFINLSISFISSFAD
jgi:magnesium chelatase family protein